LLLLFDDSVRAFFSHKLLREVLDGSLRVHGELRVRFFQRVHRVFLCIVLLCAMTEKTCNIRKREKRTIKTLHLSIKILQYLFLHKFVAQEEDSFITSRTEERDKEREKIKKPCVGVFIALSCSLILFSSSSSSW
jgi:hypothetical protein